MGFERNTDRKKITADALQTLTENKPDVLVTGCPLCKKTFTQSAPIQVLDIAEIISKSLVRKDYYLNMKEVKTSKIKEVIEI